MAFLGLMIGWSGMLRRPWANGSGLVRWLAGLLGLGHAAHCNVEYSSSCRLVVPLTHKLFTHATPCTTTARPDMPSRSPPSSCPLHQPLFPLPTNSASSQQQLAEEEWVMVSTTGSSVKQRHMQVVEEQSSSPPKPPTKKPEAVVVVDPISSGAVLALLAQQRGYAVLAVYRLVDGGCFNAILCGL